MPSDTTGHDGPPAASTAATLPARRSWTVVHILLALIIAGFLGIVQMIAPPGWVFAQDAPATPPAQVTPPANAPMLEVTFEELNDSGVTGTAQLYEDGDQTIVVLAMEGAGENHPAHIHAGTCDVITPEPAFPLANVGPGGESSTRVDISLGDLLASPYVIDLHLAPNELGTLIDCAAIEGDIQIPGGSTPDATEASAETPDATEASAETPAATEQAVETPAATEEPAETPEATRGTTQTPEPAETPETTTSTPASGDEEDGTGGAIAMSEDTASLPLEGNAGFDVTGTVVLNTVDADTTLVSIVLSGDDVQGNHPAHIHDGSCEMPGDETIVLDPVDDTGVSETEVDLSLDDLTTGEYFINVHQSEEDDDTWIACGDLSGATVGAVMPEVAPETGGGSDRGTGSSRGDTTTPTPAPTTQVTTAGDGTNGDVGTSGKGEPVTRASDLPSQAGSGSGLLDETDRPVGLILVLIAGAVVMAAIGGLLRAGAPGRR